MTNTKVNVHKNDVLSAGSVIGIEGITGNAGHRHLHFGVHHKTALALVGGIGWPSIPYRLRFVVNGEQRERTIAEIVCKHNDFDQAPWFGARDSVTNKNSR